MAWILRSEPGNPDEKQMEGVKLLQLQYYSYYYYSFLYMTGTAVSASERIPGGRNKHGEAGK